MNLEGSGFLVYFYFIESVSSSQHYCHKELGYAKMYFHASNIILLLVHFMETHVFIYLLWSIWIGNDSSVLSVSLLTINRKKLSTLMFGFLEDMGGVLASSFPLFLPPQCKWPPIWIYNDITTLKTLSTWGFLCYI